MHACGWKDPARKGDPTWADYWDESLNGRGEVRIGSVPAIETVAPFSPTDTLGWNMDVPDAMAGPLHHEPDRRLGQGGADAPAHPHLPARRPHERDVGGRARRPRPASPTTTSPSAASSRPSAAARSGKSTVIFGIEDDPQNGFDHVSGYRTTAYCASPYTKRGAVVSTQYNTTSLLRTIEQILGLPPMNQFDATATPMFDCFTATPDFRPFESVPTNIPLDTMNPPKAKIADALLRRHAILSARLNFRQDRRLPRGHAQPHPLARRQGQRRPLPRLGRDPGGG